MHGDRMLQAYAAYGPTTVRVNMFLCWHVDLHVSALALHACVYLSLSANFRQAARSPAKHSLSGWCRTPIRHIEL